MLSKKKKPNNSLLSIRNDFSNLEISKWDLLIVKTFPNWAIKSIYYDRPLPKSIVGIFGRHLCHEHANLKWSSSHILKIFWVTGIFNFDFKQQFADSIQETHSNPASENGEIIKIYFEYNRLCVC